MTNEDFILRFIVLHFNLQMCSILCKIPLGYTCKNVYLTTIYFFIENLKLECNGYSLLNFSPHLHSFRWFRRGLGRQRGRKKHGLSAPLPVLRRGGGGRGGCLVQVDLARRWAHLPHAGLGRDLRIASQVQTFFREPVSLLADNVETCTCVSRTEFCIRVNRGAMGLPVSNCKFKCYPVDPESKLRLQRLSLYPMILCGPKNCHCSRSVTLTGVTLNDRACKSCAKFSMPHPNFSHSHARKHRHHEKHHHRHRHLLEGE